jgi:hypothetical protein
MMLRFKFLGCCLVFASTIATFGLNTTVNASGTNCWGAPIIKHKLERMLVSSDRCEKPIFYLTKGEISRNVRSAPNGLNIVGKMYEVGEYNRFESSLIVTYDDGQTYWALGEVFSEKNPKQRFKGWIEVGNTKAIVQYHVPGSNDVWYKF